MLDVLNQGNYIGGPCSTMGQKKNAFRFCVGSKGMKETAFKT